MCTMSKFDVHDMHSSSAILAQCMCSQCMCCSAHAMSSCIGWLLFLCACWFPSLVGCTLDISYEEASIIRLCNRHIDIDTRAALGWISDDDIVNSLRVPRYKQWGDLFCGTGGIGAGMRRIGLTRGTSLDYLLDPHNMDILSPSGWASHIQACLAIVVFGLCFMAPPCSSFVWMSVGTTKRSTKKPKGNCKLECVRNANEIVRRTVVLMKLCTFRRVQWVVEQPMTSSLWHLPCVANFFKSEPMIHNLPLRRCFLWMGAFATADDKYKIPKPTVLYGISPMLQKLQTEKPAPMGGSIIVRTTMKWVIVNGKKKRVWRISGHHKLMKASAAYPRAFCDTVAFRFEITFTKACSAVAAGLI